MFELVWPLNPFLSSGRTDGAEVPVGDDGGGQEVPKKPGLKKRKALEEDAAKCAKHIIKPIHKHYKPSLFCNLL